MFDWLVNDYRPARKPFWTAYTLYSFAIHDADIQSLGWFTYSHKQCDGDRFLYPPPAIFGSASVFEG